MGYCSCAATYQLSPQALQFRARTSAEEASLELVICPRELDLTKGTRIRVTESSGGSLEVPGRTVILQQNIDKGVSVSLPNDQVERFVAAASYFAPTAPIADGAGF